MKIFIITEGSRKIGFGHITRCIGLYDAFCKLGILPTFILNSDSSIEFLNNNKKFYKFNWLKNETKILNLISNADIVIIDSYLADFQIYKKISELASLCVYLDDDKRLNYPTGTILNGNIHSKHLIYPKVKNLEYLLGLEYIPLRQEFWNIPEKVISKKIERVMVTFGGNDLRSITPKILEMLIDYFPDITKMVVIGKGFKNIKEIEKLNSDNTELIYYPETGCMIETMIKSDISISGGGQTLYELARIGVPTIAVAVSNNQINNVCYWKKTKFIEYAGFWNDINFVQNIYDAVNSLEDAKLRAHKSKIGQKCVDGRGAMRVAKYCMKKLISRG